MASVKIAFVGHRELHEVFKELYYNFGPRDQSLILRKSVREAMSPVLAQAKALVPRDTGALAASLQIEARNPTGKDKRSKYIDPSDTVIGIVTTAPGKKLAKMKFKNLKTKSKQTGVRSDARATAVEFGTKNMAATPFLRPALEGQAGAVLNILSTLIEQNMRKYKSRYI